ncbi:hypothetical protein K1719_040342 [Acacia pycnantha]|nr:hypothetical protein K1719_040342 [Acacia pycnantha]
MHSRVGESSVVEQSLNPGLDSIAVRVPDYEFIGDIARLSGTALALMTSANLRGQSSSVCINDFKDLWGHIEPSCIMVGGGLLPFGCLCILTVFIFMWWSANAMEETRAILEKHSLVEELTTLNEQ